MATGSTIPGWLVKTAGVLAKFLPTMQVPSLIEAGNLSHDPEIVADYDMDTLVESTITLGWLASMLAAQKEALRAAPEIAVPVLVLHSRADPVAAVAGTQLRSATSVFRRGSRSSHYFGLPAPAPAGAFLCRPFGLCQERDVRHEASIPKTPCPALAGGAFSRHMC